MIRMPQSDYDDIWQFWKEQNTDTAEVNIVQSATKNALEIHVKGPKSSGYLLLTVEEKCESSESKPEISPAIKKWLSSLPKQV